MEPFEEENLSGNDEQRGSIHEPMKANPVVGVVFVALLAIAGLGATYGFHERGMVNQLEKQAASTNTSMNQLQGQVDTLTAKLNAMSAAQTPATQTPPSADSSANSAAPTTEEATTPVPNTTAVATAENTSPATASPKPTHVKHAAVKHHAPVDKRYTELKAQLDEQGKQLKETQDTVAKNRANLEGSISSTKDELNGSIAKTHEELVALEKRGERSYFEFDLSKSKQFERVGPLTLSLRKADTKHKNYDVAMIVDDNELNKKKVNLYEPIWIHMESGGQPVQVVVNRIDKNMVHGYVSAPKYKQSELAALGSSATAPTRGNAQPATAPASATSSQP